MISFSQTNLALFYSLMDVLLIMCSKSFTHSVFFFTERTFSTYF